MPNTAEITHTITRLRGEFEALAIRGIRAAGPDDLALLKGAGEEFERIGAEHLAGRINDVVQAMEHADRGAAAALLRAQTSLRLFDRVLTLDVAAEALSVLLTNDVDEDPA
jgi:hypothetical protein